MALFAIALFVLFVLILLVLTFLFGMWVSNGYHCQARKLADAEVRKFQSSMYNNFLLSERQKYWNAHYNVADEEKEEA